MPQNDHLSAVWQEALGLNWREVQTKYLHTLGNLTLTGYNSEMSDRSFVEKRDMKGGFKDSHLHLNHGLAELDHWNQQEIEKRAAQLAELAIQIWPAPELPQAVLAKYSAPARRGSAKTHSTDDVNYSQYLQGESGLLFDQLRSRILALDPSVREEPKKLSIAYKTTANFVDVEPQKKRLRLTLNMRFDEVNDPQKLCIDITNLGRRGNGNVEVSLSALDQLPDVMDLVRQAFELRYDDSNDELESTGIS